MRLAAFGAALALTRAASALVADIRADTNRDGHVDMEGLTDVPGKHRWTESRGALFLANIGDTNRRCGEELQGDASQVSDEILMACHDAADDTQRAPEFLAPIRTVPLENLDPGAFGFISIVEEHSRNLVRLFRQSGGDWQMLKNDTFLTADDLSRGLELGIDARDTRRPGWDGRATVEFSVTNLTQTSTDTVALRVAPLLTHHHVQKAEKVFTSKLTGIGREFDEARATIDKVERIAREARVPVHRINTNDVWTQDYFEPTYMSMPGPKGSVVVMHVMVSTSNAGRQLGSHRLVFQELRDTGIGAVQYSPVNAWLNLDDFGNLETIPPHVHPVNGKEYPMGRVVAGGVVGKKMPVVLDLFRAQEAQEPLVLDSLWLQVQHLDEFLQFLPANTTRGWSIMINDPDAGMELVREARAAGLGSHAFFTHAKMPNPTVETILQSIYEDANDRAAKSIASTINLLQKETGITDQEIFRVPALYKRGGFDRGPRKRRELSQFDARKTHATDKRSTEDAYGVDKLQVITMVPNAINGLVLGNSRYVAPKPWGPIVHDVDIFERAVRNAYKKAGFDVDFVDDWLLHSGGGDIHCITNTVRDASAEWWRW
ncbi:hypothetical protein RJ55_02645 [Drechmeria coniospora]|nr:hypothetical protein RJ55_02645 [Drechmeria coniospora]